MNRKNFVMTIAAALLPSFTPWASGVEMPNKQADKRALKILLVLTSHGSLGDSGRKTGFGLEEFAAPYYVFKDAGAAITLASPKGGQPPQDPKSDEPGSQTEATLRFRKDGEGQAALANTVKLSTILADNYDAVFYPGGHGPLWDLTEDRNSIARIEKCMQRGNRYRPCAMLPASCDMPRRPMGNRW